MTKHSSNNFVPTPRSNLIDAYVKLCSGSHLSSRSTITTSTDEYNETCCEEHQTELIFSVFVPTPRSNLIDAYVKLCSGSHLSSRSTITTSTDEYNETCCEEHQTELIFSVFKCATS
jgi:hypothetical protein